MRFLVLALLALLTAACDDDDGRCRDDASCPGARCDVGSGECVACLGASDCEEGACCNGSCRTDEVEAMCGCAASPTGAGPVACGNQICIVAGARATTATVADGVCGCPCDPAQGGTLCAVNVEAAAGFSCSCDRTDPVATCEAAALDAAGIPHRPADTCSPQSSCVCFAEGAVCGGSSDCTSAGCTDLVNDVANCGAAGLSCDDDATGVAGSPLCLGGGCVCNAASDCTGAGRNVDTCAFVGEVSQCVCADYDGGAGGPAPCPMGLACADGGCTFEGAVFSTRDALVTAVSAAR